MPTNKQELIARLSKLDDYWRQGTIPNGFSSEDFSRITEINRLFVRADQLAYQTDDASEKTCPELKLLILQISAKLGNPQFTEPAGISKPPKLSKM